MIEKKLNITIFLFCLLLVVGSYYFEMVIGLVPCPLCMMQRFSLMLLTILALLGFFVSAQSMVATLYRGLFLLANGLGIYFSSRQLYLQAFPDKHLACAPGFQALLDYFPYQDIVYALFWGSGDCAKVSWRFLGGSLALWSFLSFIVLLWLFYLGQSQQRQIDNVACD